MINHNMMIIFLLLAMLATIQPTNAGVTYTVNNTAVATAGGMRFEEVIRVRHSKRTLRSATRFIWRVLREPEEADRKNVTRVTMFVDDMEGVAYAIDNEIHVSAGYIGNYTGDVKTEIAGVLYHEMTHIWQWGGDDQTPGGLIEGVADYVRLKANYLPSHWVKPGQGDKWDQGYDVTARFLNYCNDLRSGFVAEMNKKMKTSYSDQYFVDLLGKSVEQLWSDYKAKY